MVFNLYVVITPWRSPKINLNISVLNFISCQFRV